MCAARGLLYSSLATVHRVYTADQRCRHVTGAPVRNDTGAQCAGDLRDTDTLHTVVTPGTYNKLPW